MSPVPTPGAVDASEGGPRAIAILLPYGNDGGSFFSETLQARMCEEARLLGHRATLLRVYYDGADPARDAEISARVATWLEAHAIDLVVTERLFDPAPVLAHRAALPGRRVVLLAQGETPRSLEGVDFVLGEHAGRGALPRDRMAPADQLLDAWLSVLDTITRGAAPSVAPGVGFVEGGVLQRGLPLAPPSTRRAFRATVHHEVIALTPPPPSRRKTLHGTYGCPYSGDPITSPFYARVTLPTDRPVARLGCAFCPMGGDYIAGSDASIVHDVLEQARFWVDNDPNVNELVLSDQHPIRYLAALVAGAAELGLRPVRWLFAARADAFVRERDRLENAIVTASRVGQRLEVYLTGFESFSDAELERYNKGVTAADEIAAVEQMRALHRAYPDAFEYANARGHSLILWNPWTQPDDLRATLQAVRTHGLRDLFHELGRNRLRLYPNLPIFHAALRDGAVDSAWDAAGEGTARAQGYGAEHPWRFLDDRTRLAFALASALRARMGSESELGQLAGVVAFVDGECELADRADVEGTSRRVLAGLDAIDEALAPILRRDGPHARQASRAAARVAFSGACNNGCASCSNRDVFQEDDRAAVLARIDAARATSRAVMLVGREPTVHPDFVDLVAHARGADDRSVGVVTNGRRFAYRSFVLAARRAGLVAASVKLFGADDATSDAFTRVPGAHAQALAGLAHARAAGLVTEVRVPLHRTLLGDAPRVVELAARVGATHVRVELALDAIGLANLGAAADAIGRIDARANALGLAIMASPVGHPGFDALPVGFAAARLARAAERAGSGGR